jgi:predicted cupin superfamily sugar epimerase
MPSRHAELVTTLALAPHPEGGHYRECFRSPVTLDPGDGRRPRAALTLIWFLLAAGEQSAWHRVASDESWHLLEGDGLELWLAPPEATHVEVRRLGPVGPGSDGPQQVVPAGWWQAARPTGALALVGCAVAPGFDFTDFTFLRDAPRLARAIADAHPHAAALL